MSRLLMHWARAWMFVAAGAQMFGAENPFLGSCRENCAKSVSTSTGCIHQSIHIEGIAGGSVKISDEFTTATGEKQNSTGSTHSTEAKSTPRGRSRTTCRSFGEFPRTCGRELQNDQGTFAEATGLCRVMGNCCDHRFWKRKGRGVLFPSDFGTAVAEAAGA